MSLSTIAQTFYNEAATNGQVILNDALFGNGNDFSSLVIDELLRPEGNIVLNAKATDIPQNPTGNSFSFPASLPGNDTDSFLQLLNNTVRVLISQTNDGVAQMQLTINLTVTTTGTTNWVFSTSYPDLLGWPFNLIPFTNPQLIIVYGAVGVAPPLLEGVNFSSDFTLTGVFTPIQLLLKFAGNKDPQTSYFQGLITQTENGPIFDISGTIEDIPPLNFSALTVSQPVVTMSMDYDILPDNTVEDWGQVILNTQTTFDNNGAEIALTSSFILSFDPDDLNLSLIIQPTPGSLSTSLDNLGNWMGGQTWNQFFSKPPASALLPLLQSFGLQAYSMEVDVTNLKINYTSLSVGTLQPWGIIPGTLQVDYFSVDWQILDPFGDNSYSTLSIEGEVTLFGKNGEVIHFTGAIQLPDLLLEMSLSSDTEMTAADWIQTLVSAFGGGTIPSAIHDALAHFSMQLMTFTMSVPGKSMTFDLIGTINVGDNQIGFTVSLGIEVADAMTYDIEVAFAMNSWAIKGKITNDNEDKDVMVVCSWQDENNPITLLDIATALGFESLNIPAALLLDLKLLSLSFNISKDIFAIAAESADYGSADLLVYKLPDIGYTFFGGMNINSTISLSNLPVIGKKLSAIESVEVKNIQALVSSQVISADNVKNLNKVIAAMPDGSNLPQIPDQGMASTVNLSMTIDIGGYIIPVSSGLGGNTDGTAPSDQEVLTGTPSGDSNAPITTTPANQSDGTCWLNLQKAVGPLMFRRIGIKYADPVLWFLLDVSFEGGGLTIDLNGAAVGSPLDSFDPSFAISGIGIDYRTAGFELGGTLMKITPAANVEWQYAGGVVARLEGLSLSALGSYANIYTNDAHTDTMPSMFLFAQVTGNLGGVPAFFITGLSAGFGFNSFLRIPGINEVQNFPLVAGLSDPSKIGGKNASPDEALSVLMGLNGGVAWVSDQLGQYWLAAGLRFKSFELVSTNALLVAQFGTHFQFALLGLSKASFPIKSSKTYGYVEMQLEVIVDPTVGFICLTAVLSANSYVLDPACKLTGGFAFYAWFSPNTHAGDFVITLGGYHPSFDVPYWYPEVPAVGFSWAMDSTISLRGTAYFALTPAAVMAGGELDATYHDGDLKAWFKAWANVLIYWNPFHFDIAIGITVGASYRINLLFTHCTMTASLGATLHIWGPETGGTVRVNWTVISFTISFGAGATGNPGPVSWTGFLDQLPDGSNVVRVLPGDGLAANGNSDMSTPDAAWQVRPGGFAFNVISAVPTSLLTLNNNRNNPLATGNLINIRAMQDYRKNGNKNQGRNLQSILNLVVKKDGQPIDTLDSSSTWNITARSENIPKAMWGTGPQDQMPEGTDQLLNDQLTGFVVNSPSTVEGYTPGSIDANASLTDLVLATGELPINTTTPVGTAPREDAATLEIITAEIATGAIATARNSLFSDLLNLGVNPVTNDDMSKYATDAASIFSGVPMILKPTANA
jgi:hypothetical protein